MTKRVLGGLMLTVTLAVGCGDDSAGTSDSTGTGTDTDTTTGTSTSAGPGTTIGPTQTGGSETEGETGTTEEPTSAGTSTTTIEPTTDPMTSSTTDPTTGGTALMTSTSTGPETTTGPMTGTESDTEGTGTTGVDDCLYSYAKVSCDDADNDPYKSMGFNCDPNDDLYGVQFTPTVPINGNPDEDSWRVVTGFGLAEDAMGDPFWGPQEGEKFLVISTGDLRDPFMQTGLLVNGIDDASPGADNDNDNNVAMLPAPVNPIDGSNNGMGGTPFVDCDLINDCSDTLAEQWMIGNELAHDVLHFGGELTTPMEPMLPNATGYEFRFAFFSAEYPNFIGSQFNDIFIVWSTSEAYTGNVTFINDQPLTVTALQDLFDFEPFAPELQGTGFDHVGGATNWFTAEGATNPGETWEIHFMIFDMGDPELDTTVLLDDFKWVCEGCIPSEVMGCGID